MKLLKIASALMLAGVLSTGAAETVQVSGIGKAQIGADIVLTRTQATEAAKRAALVAAVNKINGANASNDPKVQAAIDNMIAQIGDDLIQDQTASRDAANNFVVRVTLAIEDLQLRTLLSDAGIASTTARNFPLLLVMDEFFTTPTDKTKPLRELVEYSHDKSSASSASASNSSASSVDASASSASASSSRGSAAVVVDNGYAVGAAASRSSSQRVDVSEERLKASDSSSSSSAQSASQNDVVSFKKLVEYQPQNVGPDKQNYTYAALLGQAAKFDLKILDNDLFKSKYFNGKPLTIQEMQEGREFARFVEAARDENKADYFGVGSSIIYQNGVSASTGQHNCVGVVTIKAYSTEDGEVLTADSRSETGSGSSPDQCRVNVANKMAEFLGNTMGKTIGDYWKKREMYGREYSVTLVSLLGNLSEDNKDDFADALEGIKGVASKVIQRKSNKSMYEVSLTYKGDGDMSRELRSAFRKLDGFEKAGRVVKGTSIRICLEGPCP